MTGSDRHSKVDSAAERRRERLAAELRANLSKRKKQARARSAEIDHGGADSAVADEQSAKS